MRTIQRLRTAVSLCAAAAVLALSGCAKQTDLSDRFGDYFKYTFGDDYQFSFVEHEENELPSGKKESWDNYNLMYRSVSGSMGAKKVSVFSYKDSEFRDEYTEDAFYTEELETLIGDEVYELTRQALKDQVLTQCFPALQQGQNGQLGENGSDGVLLTMTMLIGTAASDDKTEQAIFRKRLEPGTGIRLSSFDLKTALEDETIFTQIVVSLNPEADAAAYTEQLQTAIAKIKGITDKMQNYGFAVKQYQPPESEDQSLKTVWCEYCILGEVLDKDAIDARKAASSDPENYTIQSDIRDSLRAKYQS